ncbi:hypothetical protein ISCGN_021575 [Ixodes scapularis]
MLFEIVACLALGLSAILYRVYKSCKKKATFFKDLGVPGPTPHPIYGNLLEILEMVRHKRAETLGLHDRVPQSQTTPAVDSTMLFGIVAFLALGLSAILYRVYKSCKKKATFFKDLGVPGPTPHPIYGNLLEILEMGSLEATEKWATKYGDIAG